MHNPLQRILSLVLTLVMLISMAACNVPPKKEDQMQWQPTEPQQPSVVQPQVQQSTEPQQPSVMQPQVQQPTEPQQPPVVQLGNQQSTITEELTREEKEEVAQILGGESEDVSQLPDEELDEIVDELIDKLEQEVLPETDVTVEVDEDAYDENGAMDKPFDQVYPELVEKEEVKFDDETLLVKLHNSLGGVITDGMRAAGVAALEAIVPMETFTWYKAKLVDGTDAMAAITLLRGLPEVVLVEYDYQIQTTAIDHYKDLPGDRGYDNNKHHHDQWYMHHCGIPDGYGTMQTLGGSPSVVVAVIDTGVDYDHEDLAQNMWFNAGEVPDDGIDNDGNGYVDDYYGINLIAGKGSADDDNGHGTHVAGIIAAQNNNLGTVGIAYNVKIMAIKAAMASGYLHQSDIAKAVLYAYENGAEIINMSFGGTACSIAVQDALAVAYTRCVLVASAGNDGKPNEPTPTAKALPNYPAALNYVLGVMSVDQNGVESGFTNYDVKGFNGIEYELYAPGESMMSTLPGNRYGILSGTSMAAPVVAAFAAILRSEFADRELYPTKFIYGQLASTSSHSGVCLNPDEHGAHNLPKIVDLYAALTKLPKPDVGLRDYALFDTAGLPGDLGANNGDGVIDAGETIALGLTLRNHWGMSRDTVVTVDTLSAAGVPDPYVTIHNPQVNYGGVGTYSDADCGAVYSGVLLTGWENPFYITVSSDCPDNYILSLNVRISCGNGLDESDTACYTNDAVINLTVRSGVVLPSVIEEDMVLTADNLYIIPSSTIIMEGATVRVEPGTNIQFWSSDPGDPYAGNYIAALLVRGRFIVEGTRENPVRIFPSDLMDQYLVKIYEGETGYVSLTWADVTNFAAENDSSISYAEHCTFRVNYNYGLKYRILSGGTVYENEYFATMGTIRRAKDCVFYKISDTGNGGPILKGLMDRCIFVDSTVTVYSARNCVFLGNYDENLEHDYRRTLSLEVQRDDLRFLQGADVTTVYHPESATTYFRIYKFGLQPYWSTIESYIKMMGGSYAKFETQQELEDLRKQEGAEVYTGITYDRTLGRYVWHDGTDLPDWIDPDGVADTYQPSRHMVINGSKLKADAGQPSLLFEIPGEPLPLSITFPEYEVEMDLEQTYQIEVQNEPFHLENGMFLFESSDETVLTVSDTGLVTPVGTGSADVYVYSRDRAVYNYITFHVRAYVPLESLAFRQENYLVPVGQRVKTARIVTPADTTRTRFHYTSADESIATVDQSGGITGISSGTTTITAELDGITATTTVTVYNQATQLQFRRTGILLPAGTKTAPMPELLVSAGAETILHWASSDPEVVQLGEDGLTILKSGTVTVTVRDERSGLSDAVQIFVSNSTAPAVVQTELGNRNKYNRFVLTADGKLYFWDAVNNPVPTVLLENVATFDAASDSNPNVFAALVDGTTVLYQGGGITETDETFLGKTIVDVAYWQNGMRRTVVLEDGTAYGKSSYNPSGALGTGTTGSVGEYTKIALEDPIISVKSANTINYFLTENRDLYFAGGSYSVATPYKIGENVLYFAEDGFFATPDSVGIHSSNVISATFTALPFTVRLAAGDSYDSTFGLCGDEIRRTDGKLVLQGITDPTELAMYPSETYYAVASDGLLFVDGVNRSNAMTANSGIAEGAAVERPLPIPMERFSDEVLTVTATEDPLVLHFNKSLSKASVELYAADSDTPLTITATIHHNCLHIASAELADGETYRLVVTEASGIYGAQLTESTEFTFTYTAPAAEDVPEETVPTIRQSQTDASIRRYLSGADVLDKIIQLQQTHHYNEKFFGNVILNRLSTDTDTSRWFRITAPTVTNYEELSFAGNYWGSADEAVIDLQILDFADYVNYSRIMYAPYLKEAPENTFPFVTGITVFNKAGEPITTAGNEEITVRVTFNRDMDTTIALMVRFGSAQPFGDYEIPGAYVDSRTWEGRYTLNTLIENGKQYFTVENGFSATEDLALQRDVARFGFAIDTTAAQALIMQGYATDTGINLSWTQDDFDTLMGYNVYRAHKEDGLYTRLNDTVIPADTMTFFDDTVEPGQVYYYNFTVVQTDLTESEPSGKITLMSKDTMAPAIYHSPVANAATGANLVITATVTDNLTIAYADLYYRTAGETAWKLVRMNKLNDKYSAIIPAGDITSAGLEYYIDAFDGVSHTYKATAEEPFFVAVMEAVEASSLGDVDGDGTITNRDALILLYAINDKYNLTAEEFARADLNGDGELWAAEALRILQYVSGAVGSVTMP